MNMCKNIGCDGSGKHCGVSNEELERKLGKHKVSLFPNDIIINDTAVSILHGYYKKRKHFLPYRVFKVFREEGLVGICKRLKPIIRRFVEKKLIEHNG